MLNREMLAHCYNGRYDLAMLNSVKSRMHMQKKKKTYGAHTFAPQLKDIHIILPGLLNILLWLYLLAKLMHMNLLKAINCQCYDWKDDQNATCTRGRMQTEVSQMMICLSLLYFSCWITLNAKKLITCTDLWPDVCFHHSLLCSHIGGTVFVSPFKVASPVSLSRLHPWFNVSNLLTFISTAVSFRLSINPLVNTFSSRCWNTAKFPSLIKC